MKRAEVWQEGGRWVACVYPTEWNPGRRHHDKDHPIAIRDWPTAGQAGSHPTHAAALAHALAATGLTPSTTEPKEQKR